MNPLGHEAASSTPPGDLRFQVLGPLAVRAGDRWLRLGGPGQRSLLAALLLRANHVVSSDRLIEAIWDQTPPRTAGAKLQAHVSALRHALGNPLDPTDRRPLLVTRPPGYSMIVQPEQLDLSAFEALAEEGLRLLREEPALAAGKLRDALSLWHGAPLEGIVLGGTFEFETTRIEERHFSVLEERIEADLALGRHAELIAELEELAQLHPLRERVQGQLMLALYRSGRRAEALEVFQRARRLLVGELGLEPGDDLQRLERGILKADPELSTPAPPPHARPADGAPPFPVSQLPAAVDVLIGRDEVLGRLHAVLTGEPPWGTSAPPVAIVSGLPGVGKTAPADDRRRLDELMVGDLDVRAILTLSYTALRPQERRAFRLAGLLPMPDFACWMVAALLEVDAATAEGLLEGLVNASLVDVSGIDAAGQTRYSFHGLLRALALERAHDEEQPAALAAAERQVIAAYTAMAQRAEAAVPGMRGLSGQRLPGPGADLAETAPDDPLAWFGAERPRIAAAVARACSLGLDELACALAAAVCPYLSLRGHHEDWRRAQVLAIGAARKAGNRRGEAYARCWLGHCHLDRGDPLGAGEQFDRSRALFVELGDPRGEAYALHGLGSALHGRGRTADALRWLERSLWMFQQLGDLQGQAWSLFNLGACQLERAEMDAAAGRLTRSIELFGEIDDPLGRAYAVRCLASAHQRLGRLPEAVACLLDSFRFFAALGDKQGQAIAVLSLGVVYGKMGRVAAAMACLQSSLEAFTELGSQFRVGATLYELGQLHQAQGRTHEATECYRHALRVFREVGVRVWEARALRKIGDVLATTDAEAAGLMWSEALAISRDLGAPEAAAGPPGAGPSLSGG